MTDNTKMREAFEKFAMKEGMILDMYNLSYLSDETYSAWKAWQAAQMECKHSESVPTRLPTDAAFRWLADNAVEPEATVQKLGKRLAEMLDEHHFSEVEALLIRILHAKPVPVVGEPVAWLHDGDSEHRVVTAPVKAILVGAKQKNSDSYSIPLFVQPTNYIPATELERLRKDAERYRWLRDGNDNKKSAACHIAVNCYGLEWDAAIDAAIAGEKK